jgi:hypothetical protein
MKSLRLFALATISLFLLPTGSVDGRIVRVWSEEELFAKSDLVLIATPTKSESTNERTKLEWWNLIGVETTFEVFKVLKGDQNIKTVVLHHYRYVDWHDEYGVNSFALLSFDPAKKQTFRMFLLREASGRYAPVAGQLDNAERSVQIMK